MQSLINYLLLIEKCTYVKDLKKLELLKLLMLENDCILKVKNIQTMKC